MDSQGREMVLLVDVGLFGAEYLAAPAWSHDGRRIAFQATPSTDHVTDFSRSLIVTVDMTKPADDRFQNLGWGNAPDWSPDDRQIAFHLHGGNPESVEAGVWIMNADGAGRRLLAPGLWNPRWSPDRLRLLCTDRPQGAGKYVLVNVATGIQRQVLAGTVAVGIPAWEPTGKRVCVAARWGDRRGLTLVNLATGQVDVVIDQWQPALKVQGKELLIDSSRPAVSPDGREVLFTDHSSGRPVLKRGTLSGQRPAVVVAPRWTAAEIQATWSPDGKRLAFSSTMPPDELLKDRELLRDR
ncbi:MAG: hypothetical protein ACKV0T_22060 [Planctomycetales bacterium]